MSLWKPTNLVTGVETEPAAQTTPPVEENGSTAPGSKLVSTVIEIGLDGVAAAAGASASSAMNATSMEPMKILPRMREPPFR